MNNCYNILDSSQVTSILSLPMKGNLIRIMQSLKSISRPLTKFSEDAALADNEN